MPIDTAVFERIFREKEAELEAERNKAKALKQKSLDLIREAYQQTYRFGGFREDYIQEIAERALNGKLIN